MDSSLYKIQRCNNGACDESTDTLVTFSIVFICLTPDQSPAATYQPLTAQVCSCYLQKKVKVHTSGQQMMLEIIDRVHMTNAI